MKSFFDNPPAGWTRTRLRFCVEGSKNGAWGSDAGSDDCDAICVRVADFDWDRLRVALSNPTVRSLPRAQFRKLALKPGDILLEKSGGGEKTPVGRSVLFDHSGIDAVTSNFVSRLRPSKEFSAAYLSYLVASLYHSGFSLQFIKQNTGIQNLDDTGILSTEVYLPDLDTQKAIAAFLDRETARIDQLIEKKQRLVALLEEKEKAILHHAFEVLDDTPWRLRHLGRVEGGAGFPVELQGQSDEEIAFFKVKHLADYGLGARLRRTDDRISRQTAKKLRATIFPEGTIVFAKIGAALMMSRFSMLGSEGCIDNNVAAFIPDNALVDPDFALLALSRIDMAAFAQPGAVPSLNIGRFLDFAIPKPTLEAQRHLVAHFHAKRKAMTGAGEAVARSIDRLREFRAALITAAVTGRIDPATWRRRGDTDRRLDQIEEALAS